MTVQLFTIPGRITNSDLELAALVLKEATFPFMCTIPAWRDPFTGSDNTPIVAWSFRESSTINPVVADLLRIRYLVNRKFCITPSVLYHPGPLNTMADDESPNDLGVWHLSNEERAKLDEEISEIACGNDPVGALRSAIAPR